MRKEVGSDPLPETPVNVYTLGVLVAPSIVLQTFVDVLQSHNLKSNIDKRKLYLAAESITRESLSTDAVVRPVCVLALGKRVAVVEVELALVVVGAALLHPLLDGEPIVADAFERAQDILAFALTTHLWIDCAFVKVETGRSIRPHHQTSGADTGEAAWAVTTLSSIARVFKAVVGD